jgi:DNA primase
MIPNKKILLHLSKRFKTIIIWFDNDSTGITNSKIVSDYINNITKLKKTSSLFLPPILLNENIKDPSDYFEKKGKESLLKFLKEKQII